MRQATTKSSTKCPCSAAETVQVQEGRTHPLDQTLWSFFRHPIKWWPSLGQAQGGFLSFGRGCLNGVSTWPVQNPSTNQSSHRRITGVKPHTQLNLPSYYRSRDSKHSDPQSGVQARRGLQCGAVGDLKTVPTVSSSVYVEKASLAFAGCL